MPRPRLYPSAAARQRAYRASQRRKAVAPHVRCEQIGSCTLYQSDWQTLYALLPTHAAVISDPPYRTTYDFTTPRRRPSPWDRNFVGADTPFDPTPWLQFPEVILFGADHYWDKLPRGGSWCRWDKLAGTPRADFAACEWIWLSKDGPPQEFVHLWRGGMRAGEENITNLRQKHHPAQKPIDLLIFLVEQTAVPMVIDPFMGSGTTLAACIRLGRPCIGIEIDPTHFETACARVQDELQQLALFPAGRPS